MAISRIIKTQEDYESALVEAKRLLTAAPDTQEAEALELLTVLIEDFERRNVLTLEPPSPIEAILFRLEQLGLATRDLIPYLGSASRVSEILSGKRGLSMSMIRALHESLGIPAELLIQESETPSNETPSWESFPLQAMLSRGWIDSLTEKSVLKFVKPVTTSTPAALFRRTLRERTSKRRDHHALIAWMAAVYHEASALPLERHVDDDVLEHLAADVVRLSWSDEGPRLAVDFLHRHGIRLVIVPSLPQTFVDGVTMFTKVGIVIGLTLRFDRLDAFWFTLTHELAHVALHRKVGDIFVDDLETKAADTLEADADIYAAESLIPAAAWRQSPASRLRSRQAAEHLAKQLRIHPSIVAGRMRREFNSYYALTEMIGTGEARKHFPEVVWE